jgi:DNA-binding response OmpR family regulator
MNESVNILIIEDDEDINRLLSNIVSQNGYSPKSAYSGTEAAIYLENQTWDMVLLDLMLPGLSGEEILMEIAKNSGVPVIVISAKLETHTKIAALRAGADDYITKPFDVDEVSARIDSCLRRHRRLSNMPATRPLRHKDLVLECNAKKVVVNGTELKVTLLEYEILFLLLSSPQKVFTKANLFQSVWHEEYYGDDNTVNVHMSNIRKKLALANPEEEYIETIWGMGYRLKT